MTFALKNFSSRPNIGVHKLIDKSHRWKNTALAAAAAVFCLWSLNATALSLGRITVQSALGEPLRAEVEVPEINADEAASLKASVALPEAFRAAGLDYNSAMASLQVSLQRRADGRAYIRISGDKAINDPFVDMILEARWASGRIVRDYTMLFDPPKVRLAAPSAPTPAQVAPQSLVTQPPAAAAAPQVRPPAPASLPSEPRKTSAAPGEEKPVAGATALPVMRGDTAGKIAARIKTANVSLDQMLVAMLRSNPSAFVGDNINRIKAGSVINIPTAEQASATTAGEATRIIVAQSKDFNDFRRKLASGAPEIPVTAADRQVSGSVKAKVEDKKPTAATPDKLTLTKGALQGKATEEQLAAERSAKEATSRAAEITRNISELTQLSAASSPTATAPLAAASQTPTAAPAVSAAVASSPVSPISAPAVANTLPLPMPASPISVASAPKTPLTPVADEASMLDALIEDPLVPAGALGLILLLAGLGIYRVRQRKNAAQVDNAFQESRSRPDSFFGASGGQSINTNENAASASSMMYSPSQLDSVDDVDPVAEADVYLAYGRDIQAEEILKDALLTNPERLAIHHKLLEIYTKRRDTQAFESIARQAFSACQGDASEWERICVQGLSIDPGNALYRPGASKPIIPDESPLNRAAMDDNGLSLPNSATLAAMAPAVAAGSAVDLDLDLDFSTDDEPVSALSATNANRTVPEAADTKPEPADLDLDFGTKTQVFERPKIEATELNSNAIEFTLPDLNMNEPPIDTEAFKQQAAISFGETGPAPLSPLADQKESAADRGMLEFDLDSISLDLGDSNSPVTLADQDTELSEDPLVTKLALAEEFRAIGDDDGARALIDEVIAEATGDMKIKAQRALSNL